MHIFWTMHPLNPLQPGVAYLYPLKTSNVFSGYRQKQPPEVFYEKRCFWKFRKIYRKTPVPGSLF